MHQDGSGGLGGVPLAFTLIQTHKGYQVAFLSDF